MVLLVILVVDVDVVRNRHGTKEKRGNGKEGGEKLELEERKRE